MQYSTVQYNTIQYNAVQYSTVQYSTVQYSTVQYSTYVHINNTQNDTMKQNKNSDKYKDVRKWWIINKEEIVVYFLLPIQHLAKGCKEIHGNLSNVIVLVDIPSGYKAGGLDFCFDV